MRRFFFLMFVLFLLLAFGREVTSAASRETDSPIGLKVRAGEDLDRREEDRESRRRYRTAPRARDGRVRFRLNDDGYESVALVGSFNDWTPREMEYDEKRDLWETTVPLERGSHRYAYLVREADGDERRRRDPSNPRRARDEDRRWVSELVLGKDGRVVSTRDDGELDLLSEALVDYQRVDGLWLGTAPRFESNLPYAPNLDGRVGYGFASERWSALLELEQPLTAGAELAATVSLYDTTDFTDQTGVGNLENLLTTLVVREDHRDYWRREGLSLGLTWEVQRRLEVSTEVRIEDQSSLSRATRGGWGGREMLMVNPAIDDGTYRSLFTELYWGRELRHLWLTWELSQDDLLSTARGFSQITTQARHRFRLGRDHSLDLRLKGGANLSGDLPAQKRYVLGGIGTVRGYQYQSLLVPAADAPDPAGVPRLRGGEKMLLANAEYLLGVDHDLQLVLLFDSGMAWEDRDTAMDLGDLVSSAGVGIQFDEDTLRINVVKPLDGDGDVMVQARLNRMF